MMNHPEYDPLHLGYSWIQAHWLLLYGYRVNPIDPARHSQEMGPKSEEFSFHQVFICRLLIFFGNGHSISK